ncbi:aspartate kinase [Cognatitamlana onchidii]|uniref:aspartate kinase n=1 Tax=Cognatitamlana onchidii TaxID=2562860 RepID=UPI0010A676AB|nr:aspartate kinase [Algibacter onchidii]
MKVLKFGGTSVGSVENMGNVKSIINDGDRKIVVLSAMSGTTNHLVSIAQDIKEGEVSSAQSKVKALHQTYQVTVDNLLQDSSLNHKVKTYVSEVFSLLGTCINETYSEQLENKILAQGELLSTYMFTSYLNQEGVNAKLLPALDFMKIDANKEPDQGYIRARLNTMLEEYTNAEIFITQGFICLDAANNISNLQRGGSDFTATIIGAAILAEEVQIWTDIDGMHNNDPRYVENTNPISNLSFDEAAELAYFGAKILHPQTVTPVRTDNIPVRLKNTMDPPAHGTLISSKTSEGGVKAIAAKDGITAIKIKSARMLQTHGFLKKVFEIFETYETPIDMITTSEVAVSLTIDDDRNLDKILNELEQIAKIEVDKNQSIVCLVGHSVVNDAGTYKLFQILKDVKIRMISYGGSKNNISLLIDSNDKITTLQKLNDYLFELVTL